MMKTHLPLLALALLTLTSCKDTPEVFCDLPTELPSVEDVPEGRLIAQRDGQDWSVTGSWGAGPATSIDVGGSGDALSIIIARDETGTPTDELLDAGALPVCVQIGDRSDSVGQANFLPGGFVSDATHSGTLSILEYAGDLLIGRFSFSLASPSGETMELTEGAFRLPQR